MIATFLTRVVQQYYYDVYILVIKIQILYLWN